MTYGTEVKRGREALGLTQEQLAEALNVSRQAVSKWEMDLSRPTREKLARLSEVLNIPAETWEAIDAERAAAERPGNPARPWQIAAAVLAALCLILAVSLTAALRSRPAEPEPAPPETEPAVPFPEAEPEDPFPESLALEPYHDYDFGDCPYGAYDRESLPMLDEPEELAENTLWEGGSPESGGIRPHLPAGGPGGAYAGDAGEAGGRSREAAVQCIFALRHPRLQRGLPLGDCLPHGGGERRRGSGDGAGGDGLLQRAGV